jgi:hypothetical protein
MILKIIMIICYFIVICAVGVFGILIITTRNSDVTSIVISLISCIAVSVLSIAIFQKPKIWNTIKN